MKILIFGDTSDWNVDDFSVENIPEQIRRRIKEVNLCIYNLEGPVVFPDKKYYFQISQNKFRDLFWKNVLGLFKKRQPIVLSTPVLAIELKKLNNNTIFTLANNHIKDAGVEGLKDCLAILRKHGIKYLGAGFNQEEATKELCLKKSGWKICILNYNFVGLRKIGIFANIYGARENDFGASYKKFKTIKNLVEEKRREGYCVILIMHMGKVAKTIEKAGINIRQVEQLGADLHIIHHPHHFIPIQSRNTFVLGDFIFGSAVDQNINFIEVNISNSGVVSRII